MNDYRGNAYEPMVGICGGQLSPCAADLSACIGNVGACGQTFLRV